MANESPIIFTITNLGGRNYQITTKDLRGKNYNACTQALFYKMKTISEELNNKGLAVLFECE